LTRPPNRDDCSWLLDGVEPYLVANRKKETEDRSKRASVVVANPVRHPMVVDNEREQANETAVADNELRLRVEGEEANTLLRVAMGLTVD
jgi:hypothetical protein